MATSGTIAGAATVTITAARLAELERCEAIVIKRRTKDLAKLSLIKASDTPEKSKERALKHYALHKDEINAKRREKRRLEKEAKKPAAEPISPGEGSATGSLNAEK